MTDRPYMPSSGTEGECFQCKWCENCSRESYIRGGKVQCPILDKSFTAIKGPKQWVYKDDIPTCTSFRDRHIKHTAKKRINKSQPQLF